MATLLITKRTHLDDLLEAFPEALGILAWSGEDPDPGEYETIGEFADACGLDIEDLLSDLRTSLHIADSNTADRHEASTDDPADDWSVPDDWSDSDEERMVAMATVYER